MLPQSLAALADQCPLRSGGGAAPAWARAARRPCPPPRVRRSSQAGSRFEWLPRVCGVRAIVGCFCSETLFAQGAGHLSTFSTLGTFTTPKPRSKNEVKTASSTQAGSDFVGNKFPPRQRLVPTFLDPGFLVVRIGTTRIGHRCGTWIRVFGWNGQVA